MGNWICLAKQAPAWPPAITASAGSRDLLCKWLKELAVKVIADAQFDLAALNQTAGSIRLSQELSAGSQHGLRHTAD